MPHTPKPRLQEKVYAEGDVVLDIREVGSVVKHNCHALPSGDTRSSTSGPPGPFVRLMQALTCPPVPILPRVVLIFDLLQVHDAIYVVQSGVFATYV